MTVGAMERINRVTMKTDALVRVSPLYEMEASDTVMSYEWGPPNDAVSVTWDRRQKRVVGLMDDGVGTETHSVKTLLLLREEVGTDPLIFPPDPG